MTVRHHRSAGVGFLGAALALVTWGCAAPGEPPRPGGLELTLDPQAAYTMVGRFRVDAIEPWSPSRDIEFDASMSSARIELPAGSFTLALGAGARLVCAGDEASPSAAPAPVRLVSAPPRSFSVEPGRVTQARISFGGTLAQSAETAESHAAGQRADAIDPCGTRRDIVELAAAPY